MNNQNEKSLVSKYIKVNKGNSITCLDSKCQGCATRISCGAFYHSNINRSVIS